MESKKDIYSSWVQYTTKNEEKYFRHFIQGFVNIWETQLPLDWDNPQNLPNWTEVKPDAGPHLSRLPEELLPAIGKFLFIAKDNAEKNAITTEETNEVQLLLRCLIMISRNFDNIPVLASCDYISHTIAIATSLIHQLVNGKDHMKDSTVSYCTYLCHMLECLYDPYFTWRHFKLDQIPDIEMLIHHPAALHVEIIPFIYDCFETCLVELESNLSNELLNVLGSSVSGSQSTLCLLPQHGIIESHNIGRAHNALRSICPATASLVVMVISNNKADLSVRVTAAQCFTIMVHVLIRSPPHQRQIEVGTLIELYRDALNGMIDEVWTENQILKVHSIVKTLKKAVIGSAQYALSIQGVMVNVHMLENLLNIVDKCCESPLSEPLVVECVATISAILVGASLGKEKMQRIDGYSMLFSSLYKIGKPGRSLLEAVLSIAIENYSLEESSCLKNCEVLIFIIKWIIKFSEPDQIWLSRILCQLCTKNLQSKSKATSSGAVLAILDCLTEHDSLTETAANDLIAFLEALVSHSVTVAELKHIFLLLRDDGNTKCPYWERLYHALCNIARNSCQQQTCHNYFDIQTASDCIIIPDSKKWSNPGTGLSFHCWLRLDVLEDEDGPAQRNSPLYRRQLFSLLTDNNTGMEAFFCNDGRLIIGVHTRKEFLAATVPVFTWSDGQWHCLHVIFTSARRPFGHNHLSVFIDGSQALSAALKCSLMTDPFSVCKIGCVPEKTVMLNRELKIDQRSVLGQDVSFLPSFIQQVPSYFTLPLRSSIPLDPHVKNFPPGMQDTLFGGGIPLHGQLGSFCLLQEPLSSSLIKCMYEAGPNNLHLFAPNGPQELQSIHTNLIWAFSPYAASCGECLDLSGNNHEVKITAFVCRTFGVKNVINSIGNIYVTFPILESIGKSDEFDLSLVSPSTKDPSADSQMDETEEWILLSKSSLIEKKLESNPVSKFIILLKNTLKNNLNNQEKFLKNNGVAVLGDILSKVSLEVISASVLKSLHLLLDTARDTPNPLLVKTIYQHLIFNFNIWTAGNFMVRASHLQFISTLIKEDRKFFRKKFGVQFFLDIIRIYYSQTGVLNAEDSKAIRVSILGLVKFYIQKEVNSKEISAIVGFLVVCKEEHLVIELLEMIIIQLEGKHCRDQIYLLLYESHNATSLYCLLLEKNFSMDLKQKVLKVLSILLRTSRVYERNKGQLRLQDSSSYGMYPGFISMLPNLPVSMEVAVMLLDQILLLETSSGYAGALSLLHFLQFADLDIKIEVARKILAVAFMKPNAPHMFAVQAGWQDCITRLLVRCPITVQQSSSTPDLMVFDENDNTSETDPGRLSPSLAALSAPLEEALSFEFKEVAGTVGHAVADNICHAGSNITSAVASAYSAIRQKTVEVQESIEQLGETARMRARARDATLSTESTTETESSLNAPLGFELDSTFVNRSPSMSSNEDLSSVNQTTDASSAKDSISIASMQSRSSSAVIHSDDEDDEEKVIFDVLQQWKTLDAENEGNRENELCYLVVYILFTIMWRGIDGNSKNCWKERGQVMACINLLALNNALYCSHLELKLRILEMLVQAALSDHRENATPDNVGVYSENSAQLIKWVYDLTVLDPNSDNSKKASTKLLDGVFGLLDVLLVFQENRSKEWREMAQLAFGILLSCAGFTQLEICAMATAKLNSLIMTRVMNDAEEGSYLLFTISSIIQRTLNENDQEHYSFLIPVMKALLEKLSTILDITEKLPDLPSTQSGPLFFDSFQEFCLTEEWQQFITNEVRPLHEAYQAALTAHLTEAMNTFWAECYESSKLSSHKRNREVGESKLRFQMNVVSPCRSRASEESLRFANVLTQQRNAELAVRRKWRVLKEFLCGPRGAWKSSEKLLNLAVCTKPC
nr:PREDICTED: neurobeachin-like protein 1 [Bemisia tabaci]